MEGYVLGREIVVCGQAEACAWGSALMAVSAAGILSVPEAMKRMTPAPKAVYAPKTPGAYEALYEKYTRLAEMFSAPDSILKSL